MERRATQSDARKRNHGGSFLPVLDSRKRKIPGLWQRDSFYYAQLRVDLGNGRTAPRRFVLAANNLDEAKRELERKRTERADDKLPQTGLRPKFDDLAREYLESQTLAQKKPRTQDKERQAIRRWNAHLGGVRVDKITPPLIHSYREKRLAGGVTARTVNLDTIALRHVLKFAKERALITQLPEITQLKEAPAPIRDLLTGEQFAALFAAVTNETMKNSELFKFYLRFLLLTGAREKETLAVRWSNVNFDRQVVTIGKSRTAKNGLQRDVDFSPELAALLKEMAAVRPPDTSWLFPSPQRGSKDVPAKTLRETLNLAREKAGMLRAGFHDLRHYFASHCVMAGIDFMTVASWLGHRDGGILVGKVYGHLADAHKKAAAQKLHLFPEVAK